MTTLLPTFSVFKNFAYSTKQNGNFKKKSAASKQFDII